VNEKNTNEIMQMFSEKKAKAEHFSRIGKRCSRLASSIKFQVFELFYFAVRPNRLFADSEPIRANAVLSKNCTLPRSSRQLYCLEVELL
jgi:hypothetical protein